jgi:hypothetical protein
MYKITENPASNTQETYRNIHTHTYSVYDLHWWEKLAEQIFRKSKRGTISRQTVISLEGINLIAYGFSPICAIVLAQIIARSTWQNNLQ